MMERLTKKDKNGIVEVVGLTTINWADKIAEMAERLAAYEDTGLEPEEIEYVKARMPLHNWAGESPDNASIFGFSVARIKELVQAEDEGRLVMLPCKVGDTVWFNTYEHNASVCVGIKPHTVTRFYVAAVVHGEYADIHLPLRDFGETVFLTREEAEAALKEQER